MCKQSPSIVKMSWILLVLDINKKLNRTNNKSLPWWSGHTRWRRYWRWCWNRTRCRHTKKIPEAYHFIFLRFSSVTKKVVSTIIILIAFSLLILGFLKQTLQLLRKKSSLLPWRSGHTWWCWYGRWCRHRTWSGNTKREKLITIIKETKTRVFLLSCENNNSRKCLISTSILKEHN